jgi:hypothetical protein
MEVTYYAGIDVSLRSVSICVVNDKGEVCLEGKVAAEIDAITSALDAAFGTRSHTRVAARRETHSNWPAWRRATGRLTPTRTRT